MRNRFLLTLLALLAGGAVAMADEPETRIYTDAVGTTLPYRLIKPPKVEAGKKYPLVLLLHGAGERGTDNKVQLVWWYDAKKPSLLTHPAFVEAAASPWHRSAPMARSGSRCRGRRDRSRRPPSASRSASRWS